jgi:hypothetical protein
VLLGGARLSRAPAILTSPTALRSSILDASGVGAALAAAVALVADRLEPVRAIGPAAAYNPCQPPVLPKGAPRARFADPLVYRGRFCLSRGKCTKNCFKQLLKKPG